MNPCKANLTTEQNKPASDMLLDLSIDRALIAAPEVTGFKAAAQSTLRFLQERIGFDLWMITRAEGQDWIVLSAEDRSYGFGAGKVLPWADSFCSRMVNGLGPRIAPDAHLIPAYVSAPVGKQVEIGAYIGIPLQRSDGSLFGTLCAIDPKPQAERILAEQPLIELLADLLGKILNAEMNASHADRRAEHEATTAQRDGLTFLYNRRGWDSLMDKEEGRCRRYGHPACVMSIDLDGLKQTNDTRGHAAGDELIVRASGAILGATRNSDVVARLGGDEFGVLCVESDWASAQLLLQRLRDRLEEAGVGASVGMAMRDLVGGLALAYEQADSAMYQEKTARKSSAETNGQTAFRSALSISETD